MSASPRVLVVDDEMGVRESLRAILDAECDVLTASSGAEALDLVTREQIDVMTVDLRMPGLGGIAVLERVRGLDPDLEVLIVTGCGSLDTAVQGLRFRAFDYISKPFDAAEIRGLIHKAAARRAAMRRLRAAPEQLLATLSHELRTPLNVIMGYSTILREEEAGPLSEEQRRALERIQANSTTLLSYIETLFYIADIDRGRVPLTVTPVRVVDVLGRVGGELGPRALEKGLAWRLDAPADLTLGTDEDKLLRLVRVLADNAVRFTTTGEVAVVARAAAGGVRLEVLDSGPGLPQELIAETEDTIAGRPAERPARQVGFGLRLAGRLARLLGASLKFAASPRGTSCQLAVPDLAAGDRRVAEAASA